MKTKTYTVVWTIQVDATSIRAAADGAMKFAQVPTTATVYDVVVGRKVFSVDAGNPEELITTRSLANYRRDITDIEEVPRVTKRRKQ